MPSASSTPLSCLRVFWGSLLLFVSHFNHSLLFDALPYPLLVTFFISSYFSAHLFNNKSSLSSLSFPIASILVKWLKSSHTSPIPGTMPSECGLAAPLIQRASLGISSGPKHAVEVTKDGTKRNPQSPHCFHFLLNISHCCGTKLTLAFHRMRDHVQEPQVAPTDSQQPPEDPPSQPWGYNSIWETPDQNWAQSELPAPTITC